MLRTALITLGLIAALGSGSRAACQEAPGAGPITNSGTPPSPGGAMLRAMLIPGWGHASIGSYTRGGFYFAAEMTSAFGVIRTRGRLSEARDRAALRERVLRSTLAAEGLTDPQEIEQRLGEDPALADAIRLVDAREGQQEDWVALGIFLILLSGADAFVSAHLADFPEPISLETALGASGAVELKARVFLP